MDVIARNNALLFRDRLSKLLEQRYGIRYEALSDIQKELAATLFQSIEAKLVQPWTFGTIGADPAEASVAQREREKQEVQCKAAESGMDALARLILGSQANYSERIRAWEPQTVRAKR